jgi:hypothetical protein
MVLFIVAPAFAQEDSDGDQPADAPSNQAAAADQSESPDQTPTGDVGAVIAKWGSKPTTSDEMNKAVATRWFRDQNRERARWNVPTAKRDLYLDWQAENLLRDYLGQPHVDLPAGVAKPDAATHSQMTSGIENEPQFWTVSDDVWLAYLVPSETQIASDWSADHPDEPYFTPDRYIRQMKLGTMSQFDRYRLMGVAGRVDVSQTPKPLLVGELQDLEQLAPGSTTAYQPIVEYDDSPIAIVAYDLWINSDGTLLP